MEEAQLPARGGPTSGEQVLQIRYSRGSLSRQKRFGFSLSHSEAQPRSGLQLSERSVVFVFIFLRRPSRAVAKAQLWIARCPHPGPSRLWAEGGRVFRGPSARLGVGGYIFSGRGFLLAAAWAGGPWGRVLWSRGAVGSWGRGVGCPGAGTLRPGGWLTGCALGWVAWPSGALVCFRSWGSRPSSRVPRKVSLAGVKELSKREALRGDGLGGPGTHVGEKGLGRWWQPRLRRPVTWMRGDFALFCLVSYSI